MAPELELTEYKFKELGRAIEKLDKKMSDYITESVRSRLHFQECMTKIKINVATNHTRIQSGQDLAAANKESLEDHIKEHIAERNRTLGTAGGLGAFLGTLSSFIIGIFS